MRNFILTTIALTALLISSHAVASSLFIRNAVNASNNRKYITANINQNIPWLRQNISASNEEFSMEISNAIGISLGLRLQYLMDIEVEYADSLAVNKYELSAKRNAECPLQQMIAEEKSKKFLLNIRHYFIGLGTENITPFVVFGSGALHLNIKTGIGPMYDDIRDFEVYHNTIKKAVVPVIQSGGGISIRLRPNLDLTASYLSLRMLQKSHKLNIKNISNSLGNRANVSKTKHSQNTISTGLKVKF